MLSKLDRAPTTSSNTKAIESKRAGNNPSNAHASHALQSGANDRISRQNLPIRDPEYNLRAAELGSVKAQFNLGAAYAIAGDDVQATKWYTRAGDQGDVDAQVILGERSSKAGDSAGAERWYMKAAALHDAEAQFRIGTQAMHSGVNFHTTFRAATYLRSAAQQGHAAAQHELGLLLVAYGSRNEAVHWIRAAANRGYSRSQSLLRKIDAACAHQKHHATEAGLLTRAKQYLSSFV